MSPSLLDKINRFRPVSWALVSFLSACTGPLTEDDTPPGDDDPAEDGWIRSEPEFCSSPQVEADNEDPTLWETTHYRLHLPGVPAEEATEIARLAERAFPAFAAFFGAEPSSLPLEAWLDLDAAAFQARLAEHGIPGVPEAGGWFEPGVGAFLFTQPTAYYTRVLFLHELTHQFHHATSVQGAFPFWYSEGLAEARLTSRSPAMSDASITLILPPSRNVLVWTVSGTLGTGRNRSMVNRQRWRSGSGVANSTARASSPAGGPPWSSCGPQGLRARSVGTKVSPSRKKIASVICLTRLPAIRPRLS